jgi:hypothetical protein
MRKVKVKSYTVKAHTRKARKKSSTATAGKKKVTTPAKKVYKERPKKYLGITYYQVGPKKFELYRDMLYGVSAKSSTSENVIRKHIEKAIDKKSKPAKKMATSPAKKRTATAKKRTAKQIKLF